jgi:hypothetical protein
MSDKDQFLEEFFPFADDSGEELEVCIRYNEGGINYFNYETEKRGLYIHFTPVKRATHETMGYTVTTRTLMDERGRKMLLLEMPRRNKRRATAVAAEVIPRLDDLVPKAQVQDWPGVYAVLKPLVDQLAT